MTWSSPFAPHLILFCTFSEDGSYGNTPYKRPPNQIAVGDIKWTEISRRLVFFSNTLRKMNFHQRSFFMQVSTVYRRVIGEPFLRPFSTSDVFTLFILSSYVRRQRSLLFGLFAKQQSVLTLRHKTLALLYNRLNVPIIPKNVHFRWNLHQ